MSGEPQRVRRRFDAVGLLARACVVALVSPVALFLFEAGLRRLYGAGAFQGWDADAFELPANVARGILGAAWLMLVSRTLFFERTGSAVEKRVNRLFLVIPTIAAISFCIAALPFVRVLNGLLDVRPRVLLKAKIADHWTEISKTPRGRTVRDHRVLVRTMSDPTEDHVLDWDGCPFRNEDWSRFVRLRLGRGLFGIRWVSSIECHPPEPSDEPLGGGVFLGRGTPVLFLSMRGQSSAAARPDLAALEDLAERARQVVELPSYYKRGASYLRKRLELGLPSVPAEQREAWRQSLLEAEPPGMISPRRATILQQFAAELRATADEQRRPDRERITARELGAIHQWLDAWHGRTGTAPAIVAHPKTNDIHCGTCVSVANEGVADQLLFALAPDERRGKAAGRALLFGPAGDLRATADLEDTAAISRVLDALAARR